MCLTTILTVGRAQLARDSVRAVLEEAGSRRIAITDARSRGVFSAGLVDSLTTLDSVDVVVGISLPTDVKEGRIGDGGQPVPLWEISGDASQAVRLESGRWPRVGEALVAESALGDLGLDHAVGYATNGSETAVSIVGTFSPLPPFEMFAEGLVTPLPEEGSVHTVVLLASTASSTDATQRAALAIISDVATSQDLQVESPQALADVQSAVLGDLANYGRALLSGLLVAGGLLIAVVVLADLLLRRRDIGRRRALGASRGALVWLILVRVGFAGSVGAIAGCLGGSGGVLLLDGDLSSGRFMGGIALLSILDACVAAAFPALLAAYRDPVRVLRTP